MSLLLSWITVISVISVFPTKVFDLVDQKRPYSLSSELLHDCEFQNNPFRDPFGGLRVLVILRVLVAKMIAMMQKTKRGQLWLWLWCVLFRCSEGHKQRDMFNM